MTSKIDNDLFIRACRREPVERTPVWLMRQAGRYLPEYRAVRERYDFLTMCRTPELASEVTIQPVEIVGVDAAIVFSDIMVVPEAMGMKLELIESRGPVLGDPVRSRADIESLERPDVEERLLYVMKAVEMSKERLAGRVPLIGFSGSPWTLFCYMVEGEGSKTFRHAKSFAYGDPEGAHELLSLIADTVSDYLAAQIRAGADAVQIFDTWGGILPPGEFEEFSLSYMDRIVERLRRYETPVILFAKDCSHSLERIAATGCSVVGLDWRTDIGLARGIVGHEVALQGNMDPVLLYAPRERIKRGVQEILESFGRGEGHIFNLGHGMLPDIPVDNVKSLVEFVGELSPRYHV